MQEQVEGAPAFVWINGNDESLFMVFDGQGGLAKS